MTDISIIIPLGPGDAHKANLFRVAESLNGQRACDFGGFWEGDASLCVVADGPGAWLNDDEQDAIAHIAGFETLFVDSKKFERGQIMTRNLGVKALKAAGMHPELIWFLDSDVMVAPEALRHMIDAWCEARAWPPNGQASESVVVAAPYEWLPRGYSFRDPRIKNCPYWKTVGAIGHGAHRYSRAAALCNLSGNLLWEWDAFVEVGGFHSELKRGEDGELGARAAAHGIRTAFTEARGWHQWHPVNVEAVKRAEAADIPKIDAWHPWVAAENPDDECIDVEPGIEWVSSLTGETVKSTEAWDYYDSIPSPVVKERWVDPA